MFSLERGSVTPPKRPMSAYLRYVVEQHRVLLRQAPDLKIVEKTKKIAQAWRHLTPEQKQPYEIAANEGKLKYKEEVATFKANHTPTELAIFKEEKRKKLTRRRIMRQKRKLTMLGKPKRSRTAFNIFMSEHFDEAKGSTVQAKLKNLQDEWHRLPESQKKMYTQLAEDDKIRYQNEIKSWEEQMIEAGHEDLVRMKQKGRTSAKRAVSKVIPTKAKTSKPSTTSNPAKSVKSKKKAEE
ncbi:transcription factor A, mitochondrial isoform X2 [Callorhinchus milii]|nr:transcription factor A, mitochondrial isoform X2 [Callorhinchus milii]|eukprot:gi/632936521/ref/XP_007895218.1/ PREDICTED: transcription factor A, mitochondrial [Callorhinchus milii]